MKYEIKNILERMELFTSYTDAMLEEIGEFCSVDEYPPGTVIFGQGDPGDCLFVVSSGEVAVSRLEGRSLKEIARYIPGDSFGEMDLMTGTARDAEARAEERCVLLRFPRQGKPLTALMQSHPTAGAQLLLSFLQSTAGRIRKANDLIRENSPWVQEMRNQVYQDKLTGLWNKTYLTEQLPSLLKDDALGLLMVKPDNFKEINDTLGHEAGDQALIRYAAALKDHLSGGAFVSRFAGNELALVFPGRNRAGAVTAAEDIRTFMNNLDLSPAAPGSFRLSVSIGIALYPCHTRNAGELISMAHELPLIGRSRGGNKILFPEDK
jgi:diguanylate cyclase (GGDEF)-like protein